MLTSDRRTVLKAAGAVATGGSVAAGCDLLATEPEGNIPTTQITSRARKLRRLPSSPGR